MAHRRRSHLAIGACLLAAFFWTQTTAAQTAPAVSGVTITSSPASGDTYELAEVVTVAVQFDSAIDVTGTPLLALTIGSAPWNSHRFSHDGDRLLLFRYAVLPSDNDADGISIAANALTLGGVNGATITARGSTTNASLGLGAHAISNAANHKVDGSRQMAPTVAGVAIKSRPASGDTYQLAERISVEVEFDRRVSLFGSPQLALSVGAATRHANISGWGLRWVRFTYVVQSSDADADGISIGAGALALNGGTISVWNGTMNASLALGTHVISHSAEHKVNGSLTTTPAISAVTLSTNPVRGDTYELNEWILVDLRFDREVDVTGTPQVALTVGSTTRQASYVQTTGPLAPLGTATTTPVSSRTLDGTLQFSYVVQAADRDADGIGIGANALALNGGAIRIRGGTTNASLALGSHAIDTAANHKVDGSNSTAPVVDLVQVVSRPVTGDTYEVGETITISVSFDRDVTVTGTPQLALAIGTATRQANETTIRPPYEGAPEELIPRSRRDRLRFSYTVQASDRDADGISIGPNALTLNGGTIKRRGRATDAELGLGRYAIADAASHKIDGSRQTAPVVSAMFISSLPVSGDTYELAEQINVYVGFNRQVAVTGAPQLALTIGSATRQARNTIVGPHGLHFSYTVQSSDRDANGISIGAKALTLNGGTIRHQGGITDAALDFGSHAIVNAANQKVDGSRQTAPAVRAVRFWTYPSDGTYELSELIRVDVEFDREVFVSGAPQLALTIGSATRQARWSPSGSPTSPRVDLGERTAVAPGRYASRGTHNLPFTYVVAASDFDADGISIAANALTLNGGTIRYRGGTTNAALDLGSHAVSNSSAHKVDGRFATEPVVQQFRLGNPANGDTYEFAESVTAYVTFDRAVEVTGTPRLALNMGSTTRHGRYFYRSSTGTDLGFQYVVGSSDADANGLSVEANALSLNGGSIRTEGGTSSASLSLGGGEVADSAVRKVNGRREAAPAVSAVAIVSDPPGGDYSAGAAAGDFQAVPRLGGGATPASSAGVGLRPSAVGRGLAGRPGLNADAQAPGRPRPPLPVRHAGDGEEIVVRVTFDRAVDVTGAPRLALTIGSTIRQASYFEHLEDGYVAHDPRAVYFRYAVQPSDRDTDGISVGPAALSLNGGTIALKERATNAALEIGAAAISDSWLHKVNAVGTSRTPTQVRAEATATGLEVTWAAALGATSYKVQWRSAGQAWSPSRQQETTQTQLAIEGLAPGAYEVRVVAVADGQDGRASGAAEGNVGGNSAPRLADELPDLELDVGETKTIDLASAFHDPNDDALRYSASSDSDTVLAQVVAGAARIRGVRPGEATVTVAATDPGGLAARATFKVAVGALLSLSGDAARPEGGAVVLTVALSRPLAEPLDVSWRVVADGDPSTADADAADYESAGETTIPAGRTAGAVEVTIVDDNDIESARERFVVELNEPQSPNAGLSRSTRAGVTIQEGVCDRTPAVRDQLARGWRGCHWPRPSDLARVPTLNLGAHGIDALRARDLLGLSGLRSLDLRGNDLAALPTGLFSETPRLRTLDLSANALKVLPDGLFAGLGHLREVSVEGNPGAPFGLAVQLARTDAEPWAPGPAMVAARPAVVAPFAMAAPLVVAPATSAEQMPLATVEIAAGETTGSAFAVAPAQGASLVLRTDPAPMPTARCGVRPCFRGFSTVPGPALTLFHRPPQPLAAPTPEPIQEGAALRLALDSLVAPGDAPDGMRWEVRSSDESVATARIVGPHLVVEPEHGGEGAATVTLTVTDSLGLAATMRFEVQVEFHWPSGPARGWRATLHSAAEAPAAKAP